MLDLAGPSFIVTCTLSGAVDCKMHPSIPPPPPPLPTTVRTATASSPALPPQSPVLVAKNHLRARALRARAYPPWFLAKKPIPPYRNRPGGSAHRHGVVAGVEAHDDRLAGDLRTKVWRSGG